MPNYRQNKPEADILMNSMRSMGYTFEAAISDIIDNSISAGAEKIKLEFPVHPADCYIAVCDDGCDMTSEELFKSLIQEHAQKVEWHIHRIYRARNYIVHDANGNEKLNSELLINLHSYFDILILKVVQMINASPYLDNIKDILSEHKFEVSIFDEKLAKQEKETISEENGMKYLYYDYKL